MAERATTTTSFLMLGLLASRDWTAYELVEQMRRGVGEVWPRAERQLYNAPKKLVEQGFVRSFREPAAGTRSHTVYSITNAGRDALREWLATEPKPSALTFEGMVRVMLADQGSIEDLRADLAAIIEQSRELFVSHAGYILDTDGGTFPERQHLFALSGRFLVGHFTHLIEWATWALAEIETWPDTVTPASVERERTRAIFEEIRTGEPARGPA